MAAPRGLSLSDIPPSCVIAAKWTLACSCTGACGNLPGTAGILSLLKNAAGTTACSAQKVPLDATFGAQHAYINRNILPAHACRQDAGGPRALCFTNANLPAPT